MKNLNWNPQRISNLIQRLNPALKIKLLINKFIDQNTTCTTRPIKVASKQMHLVRSPDRQKTSWNKWRLPMSTATMPTYFCVGCWWIMLVMWLCTLEAIFALDIACARITDLRSFNSDSNGILFIPKYQSLLGQMIDKAKCK